MGEKSCKIIDAGRMSTWKGLKSKDEIVELIQTIDRVQIVDLKPLYGDILGVIWDVGLRPLFNPLVKMANTLTIEQRTSIKEEWNAIFYDLFEELLVSYKPNEKSAFEYLIVLEKR